MSTASPDLFGMVDDLAVSTAMVLATVAFHGAGLILLGKLLRVETREELALHLPSFSPRTLLFTLSLVLALFVLHGIEIWAYAFVYVALGAVNDIATGVYFSTISYAAIGYSDVHIRPEWRLVGAIEGINGLLLLGWSTAFFVPLVTRLGRR
jgi:Ion channel